MTKINKVFFLIKFYKKIKKFISLFELLNINQININKNIRKKIRDKYKIKDIFIKNIPSKYNNIGLYSNEIFIKFLNEKFYQNKVYKLELFSNMNTYRIYGNIDAYYFLIHFHKNFNNRFVEKKLFICNCIFIKQIIKYPEYYSYQKSIDLLKKYMQITYKTYIYINQKIPCSKCILGTGGKSAYIKKN